MLTTASNGLILRGTQHGSGSTLPSKSLRDPKKHDFQVIPIGLACQTACDFPAIQPIKYAERSEILRHVLQIEASCPVHYQQFIGWIRMGCQFKAHRFRRLLNGYTRVAARSRANAARQRLTVRAMAGFCTRRPSRQGSRCSGGRCRETRSVPSLVRFGSDAADGTYGGQTLRRLSFCVAGRDVGPPLDEPRRRNRGHSVWKLLGGLIPGDPVRHPVACGGGRSETGCEPTHSRPPILHGRRPPL